MRATHLSMLIGSSLLALSAQMARPDASADARKAIEAGYASQSKAFVNGDPKAFAATHTPDFAESDKRTGRKHTLKELQQVMPMVKQMLKEPKRSIVIRSFKLNGKTAAVAVTEKVDGSVMNPQIGKQSQMHAERDMNDVWTLSGKTWLLKSSKATAERTTLDGKPFGSGRRA